MKQKIKDIVSKAMEIGHSAKLVLIGLAIGIVISLIWGLIGDNVISALKKKENSTTQEAGILSGGTSETEITIEYINKKLENISELSTAEMTYNGIYTVVEGNIPFITETGFTMVYSAEVKAGINASLIKTEITDDKVIVTLPEAEIQMSSVDPNSIQFYDEKHALFNWSAKTDVTEAIAAAEADVREKADVNGLLERATKQAEYVVRGILEGSVGEREIEVVHGVSSAAEE